jgi:hypothetical protein
VKEQINFPPNWLAYALKLRRDLRKVKTHTKRKRSWVSFPVKMVPIAWMLSKIEGHTMSQAVSCWPFAAEVRVLT